MNYHLANSPTYQATGGKKITNFGGDIKDSVAYACLLEQIQPVDEETKQYELIPPITPGHTLGVSFLEFRGKFLSTKVQQFISVVEKAKFVLMCAISKR